jgi:PTS system maltose and glucose-specific IIC component
VAEKTTPSENCVIGNALILGKTFYLILPQQRLSSNSPGERMSSVKQKITLWEFFQSLGKTFMLPVALLSFCGIMLGIGSSLSSHDVITLIPFLGNPLLQLVFTWMSKVGSFAFSFLPVMFAIAIPLGMARENKGVAAFSGFVGFAVMNLAVNFWLTAKGILPTSDAAVLKANNIQSILGIQSIDTGILGAVIVGIIVFYLHERFHTIRLPDALAFFGGTRFVPIITTLVMGLAGLAIPLIWPWFAKAIAGLGWVINSAGDFGPMIFGTGERLLLPFGLQHILVAIIRFTDAGGTMDVCGHSVSGALTIFQAQLSCPTSGGFSESATRFLSQGKMPAFLGGLPGAALAMYHCARPENRHKIKGLLISGVVACVVGGTTEPLEFLFLFVAPFLYLIHAVLTGLGFTVMAVLGVTIGNTDGNVIDFVVFGILHGLSTKWYWVPVVAAVWFAGYYLIFRFAITRFNIKTPGRELDTPLGEKMSRGPVGKSGYNTPAILAALGGIDNITSLDNCLTRLRLSVKDMSLVDDAALKANRVIGVVHLNQHNLQVVIGPQVQSVKDEIATLMPQTSA